MRLFYKGKFEKLSLRRARFYLFIILFWKLDRFYFLFIIFISFFFFVKRAEKSKEKDEKSEKMAKTKSNLY